MDKTDLFPLAFPVDDLARARRFYVDTIGCTEGISASGWIDFDFQGRQIIAYLAVGAGGWQDPSPFACPFAFLFGAGHAAVREFGTALTPRRWVELAGRLRLAGVPVRVERTTMHFADPFGNSLEIRAAAPARQTPPCRPGKDWPAMRAGDSETCERGAYV